MILPSLTLATLGLLRNSGQKPPGSGTENSLWSLSRFPMSRLLGCPWGRWKMRETIRWTGGLCETLHALHGKREGSSQTDTWEEHVQYLHRKLLRVSQIGRGDHLANVTDSSSGKARTILISSHLDLFLFSLLPPETLRELSTILAEWRKRQQGLGMIYPEPRYTLKDYGFSYQLDLLVIFIFWVLSPDSRLSFGGSGLGGQQERSWKTSVGFSSSPCQLHMRVSVIGVTRTQGSWALGQGCRWAVLGQRRVTFRLLSVEFYLPQTHIALKF